MYERHHEIYIYTHIYNTYNVYIFLYTQKGFSRFSNLKWMRVKKLAKYNIVCITTAEHIGSDFHPLKFKATLTVVGAAQRGSKFSVLIKVLKQENHNKIIKKTF